jgi:hypothetical protein
MREPYKLLSTRQISGRTLVRFQYLVPIWASGGMEYTLVLEANAERIESSSLSLPTNNADVVEWYTQQT